MTPPWIATFFYNRHDNSFGFSENYYPIGPSQSVAVSALTELMPLRLDFMLPTWSIVQARLDVPGSPRDSLLLSLGANGPGTYDLVSPGVELPADTAVLATLVGDSTHKNRHFLRVLATQDQDDPDHFAPTTDWSGAFSAWADALIAGFFVARFVAAHPEKTYAVACTDVLRGQQTNRKTGRPFGLRRGRR